MAAEPRKDNPNEPGAAVPGISDLAELAPAEDFAPGAATAEEADALQKLQAEKKQLMDQLLRKQAEFENFRKRTQREKEEFQQYALFDALKPLLPILDGFELALKSSGNKEDFRKGVELIYQQLGAVLQKLGLKPVEAKGHMFDPRMHEAVATTETGEYPDNQVVEELQRGYFFKGRLLRPAMVKVSKRPGGGNNAKNA